MVLNNNHILVWDIRPTAFKKEMSFPSFRPFKEIRHNCQTVSCIRGSCGCMANTSPRGNGSPSLKHSGLLTPMFILILLWVFHTSRHHLLFTPMSRSLTWITRSMYSLPRYDTSTYLLITALIPACATIGWSRCETCGQHQVCDNFNFLRKLFLSDEYCSSSEYLRYRQWHVVIPVL